MKRILFLALFLSLLLTSISYAQLYWGNMDEHMEYLRRESFMSDFNAKAYENIDGTPYMNKEYLEGKVYLKTGEVMDGKFRFDLYANQLQFLSDDRRYVIAFPEKIYKIELDGNVIKYIAYTMDAGVYKGYFIELLNGYYSLFLKKSKTLKDPQATKPYQQAKPAKFLDHKDYYYLQVGEKPAQRVSNKRDIINLCGEKGAEVEKYIKEQKISLRRDYDLVKLVTYINNIYLE
ncbi:MAG: hypothetical protein KFF49_09155 [Bacteroidales bacterium]|nr:hypothetical protein [Bacteroidales bacterium]